LRATQIQAHPALVGFDGFIDSILHMVDVRRDMSPSGYERFTSIGAFAARCAAAAGKSTNIEQVLIEDRFGGNGPLMAGALARLGMPVTYIGAVGDGAVHPVFAPFADRMSEVIAVGPPSRTDCLEFDDGKLMFNNTANVQAVTWERLLERVGMPRLLKLVNEASLLGIVNWSLAGGVPGIWRALANEVWPRVREAPRRLFVDLSDPAKRTDADIIGALTQLRELEQLNGLSVTLGLNLAESERIAAVLGVNEGAPARPDQLAARARAIRAMAGLDCVVIHPREGAAAANAAGEQDWFDGPFTPTPRLSTGAGDHFNAGFAFAQVHGLTLAECLAVACGLSGAYVRDAESPVRERVGGLLAGQPRP
ncbi:MAG: PfkB family carbohydrate kinase, partial [Phycisphaerales bacterium]